MIVHNCQRYPACTHQRLDMPHHTVRPETTHRVGEEGAIVTVTVVGPDILLCAVCGCMMGTGRPGCQCPRGCHFVDQEEIMSLREESTPLEEQTS
jgi:hypothetical protein